MSASAAAVRQASTTQAAEEDEEISFTDLETITKHGITKTDVNKFKEAGFHTVSRFQNFSSSFIFLSHSSLECRSRVVKWRRRKFYCKSRHVLDKTFCEFHFHHRVSLRKLSFLYFLFDTFLQGITEAKLEKVPNFYWKLCIAEMHFRFAETNFWFCLFHNLFHTFISQKFLIWFFRCWRYKNSFVLFVSRIKVSFRIFFDTNSFEYSPGYRQGKGNRQNFEIIFYFVSDFERYFRCRISAL